MNQILQTTSNIKNKHLPKIKFILKMQLIFSIGLILIISTINIINIFNLYKQEQYSKQLLNNYNITKLYSNLELTENSDIIGIIEIPKISIYYPIFSTCTEELLKISPCRIYGPLPGKIGNLCIASHNYDNDKFFSKIGNLKINDEIILYNNSSKKFSYYISNIYEVTSYNLSPIYSYNKNSKELTLITCNNLNNNRIIVKALYKE